MKPKATSSQAGEVTQLAEFPWRFLPSMLSELVHYKHLVLSARVITFVLVHVLSHESHSNVISSGGGGGTNTYLIL